MFSALSLTRSLTPFLQGVVSGSIIEALLCPSVPQLYYVRINGNASFSLLFPLIRPVMFIKNSIASCIGVPPHQLHVIAKGRRLDSMQSLLSLGVEPGSWLDIVVVPSKFGASTSPIVNQGLAAHRTLANSLAIQQLAVQRVHGYSVAEPLEASGVSSHQGVQ
jgi:hypothetical protein